MQLGLSTAAFYGKWETEEAARRIALLGMDCAEAFLQTTSEYDPAFAALVRDNLGDVPCVSMHPSGIQFENQMFGRSQRQRRDAFDLFRRALDAGHALGARHYIYHGRSTALLTPLPFDLEANIDMVGRMSGEASQRGMDIAWENVSWCQLTTSARIAQVRKALPEVCFTLDIKQAMRAGEDPVEMARAMGSSLVHVHVCDWDEAGKLCLPGEGCFDFLKLVSVLREMEYGGSIILEPYLALIRSDEALLASIAHLRKVIDAADGQEYNTESWT